MEIVYKAIKKKQAHQKFLFVQAELLKLTAAKLAIECCSALKLILVLEF